MKTSIYRFLLVSMVFIAMILGCGQGGVSDPMGVLGGDESSGYGGVWGGSDNTGEMDGSNVNVVRDLIGSWKRRITYSGYTVDIILTFEDYGTYEFVYNYIDLNYSQTLEMGTYSVDTKNMKIEFNPDDRGSYILAFSFRDNKRTLILGNEKYTRI